MAACGGSSPGVPPTPEPASSVQVPPAEPPEAPPVVTPATPPAKPVAVVGLRGTLTLAPPAFVPCAGSPVTVTGLERAVAEVKQALGEAGSELYVELRARPQPDGALDVIAVDVGIAEGHGCGLSGVTWRLAASGTEPFWRAEVHADRLTFQRMDDEAAWKVPVGEPQAPDARRRVWAGEAEGHTLGLDVTRTRCADAMASAFYPFEATVTLDGTSYTGCARTTPPE